MGIATLTAEKAGQESNKAAAKVNVVSYTGLNDAKLKRKKVEQPHMVNFSSLDNHPKNPINVLIYSLISNKQVFFFFFC